MSMMLIQRCNNFYCIAKKGNCNSILTLPFCKVSYIHNKKSVKPPVSSREKQNRDGFNKWFMLIFPISGLILGTWQVRRKLWKLDLISKLEQRTNSPPAPLPEDLVKLADMEYYPFTVYGAFDHSKELHIGPRQLNSGDSQEVPGSLLSLQSGNVGTHVITPFFIPDRGIAILVNRGFVPAEKKDPKTRPEGQVEGLVQVTGLLRHSEKRSPFVAKNNPEMNQWNYKDLDEIAELLGTNPVLLDAIDTLPNGPIGGQTRVTLRDEHVQYLLTWYSLAIITGILWYMKYIK